MRTENNNIITDNFDPDALDREYERRQARQYGINNNNDEDNESSHLKKSGKRMSGKKCRSSQTVSYPFLRINAPECLQASQYSAGQPICLSRQSRFLHQVLMIKATQSIAQ